MIKCVLKAHWDFGKLLDNAILHSRLNISVRFKTQKLSSHVFTLCYQHLASSCSPWSDVRTLRYSAAIFDLCPFRTHHLSVKGLSYTPVMHNNSNYLYWVSTAISNWFRFVNLSLYCNLFRKSYQAVFVLLILIVLLVCSLNRFYSTLVIDGCFYWRYINKLK